VADTAKSFKEGKGWVGKSVNETWTWNGIHWAQQKNDDSPGRYYHSVVYSKKEKAVLAFGGADFDTKKEVPGLWKWNGENWQQVNAEGPEARVFPARAAAGSKLFVLSGSKYQKQETAYYDFWVFDNNAWARLETTGLPQLKEMKMVFDEHRKVLVVFGGSNDKGEMNGNTWELALQKD
jgi:hypothetical protein